LVGGFEALRLENTLGGIGNTSAGFPSARIPTSPFPAPLKKEEIK
jgi:hypothetical protein